MQTLTIQDGERIAIGPDIVVRVFQVENACQVSIDAPPELAIVQMQGRTPFPSAPDGSG